MKINKKNTIVTLLSALFFLGIYVQYKKIKFDKVYQNRHQYGEIYTEVYNTGYLDKIKSFSIKNYDRVNKLKTDNYCRINLTEIEKITNDSDIISISKYLIKKGFYYTETTYNNNLYEFSVNRVFLFFKKTPTIHYLIYTKRYEPEYRFKSDDYWYYYSLDDKEYDGGSFLDYRPNWSLPYFETFDFLLRNSGTVNSTLSE